MLADQLPKRASILLRGLRRFADVAVVGKQQPLDVSLLELVHHSVFGFLKRFQDWRRLRVGNRNTGGADYRLGRQNHSPHDDVLQFSDVAGPLVKDQFSNRVRRKA